MADLLDRNKVSWALALDRLAAPVARVEDAVGRVTSASPGAQPCGTTGYLLARLQPLVCSGTGGEGPDLKALKLLSTPLLVEFSIDFADWMLSVSRMVDTLDDDDVFFLTADQILSQAKDPMSGPPAGRALVQEALRVLDLSIASYGILYGDLAARAALDALQGAKPGDEARTTAAERARLVLQQNSYLAANTTMLLLREHYAEQRGIGLIDRPSSTGYRTALALATAVPSNPSPPLRALFGEDLAFDVAPEAEGGRVRLQLAEDVMVPLPGVSEFMEGRFSFPPRFVAMLAQRERLFDRLMDYRFYESIGEEVRASVAALVGTLE